MNAKKKVPNEYTTVTIVLRMSKEDADRYLEIPQASEAINSTTVMFWATQEGVSEEVKALGAYPEEWPPAVVSDGKEMFIARDGDVERWNPVLKVYMPFVTELSDYAAQELAKSLNRYHEND
jgi:hypothetical protein